ncbi:dihydroxyacetone kinase subunit DhaK [Photobacterium sp. DNB23_23_1]
MKKFLNKPEDYVDEMLAGMCLAHPNYYKQPIPRLICRATKPKYEKVAIVTGGGSGHLPLFTGYVGEGLLDAASIGDVFASPSSDLMTNTIKEVDQGKGVLLLYGNYGGDVMNFDMASENVEFEDDTQCMTVLGTDDIVSAPYAERGKRRGVAGIIYAYKTAGAMAETGASLEDVTRVAQKTVDMTRTMGCALTPCTLPRVGEPTFSIPEGKMEMGMGIHGEPGIHKSELKTANEIADEIIDNLLPELELKPGNEVSVLVNSLGATPLEELYILYNRISERMSELGVSIVLPLVGRYVTSMEMTGASISLCKLDEEMKELLLAPAECAFWKV